MFENKQTDKSWGMVGFYRTCGGGQELFGSDVTNYNSVRLVIKHAVKHRELGRDWTMGDDVICEVALSSLQFSELLTNMNVGDGVPCTIRYTQEDGYVDYKPEKSKVDIIREERSSEIDKSFSELQEAINQIETLIDNKKLSKTIGSELLQKLNGAISGLEGSNYDFYKKRAEEEVAQIVVEAKSQISEHINNKIYSVGLENLMKASEVTPMINGSIKEEETKLES